jgi:hypothetical protein
MKGIAFDEGVNAMVFLACIIILGIFFYVSGINPLDILSIGTSFVSQITTNLVRSLTGGLL